MSYRSLAWSHHGIQNIEIEKKIWATIFLVENSEILIFTIFSKLEGEKKKEKGIHCLGQGF